jgi:hypothetical protein
MAYMPDSGNIIWIMFNPQAGHKQAEHRPALVLSPKSYNGKVDLAFICPITIRSRGVHLKCGSLIIWMWAGGAGQLSQKPELEGEKGEIYLQAVAYNEVVQKLSVLIRKQL